MLIILNVSMETELALRICRDICEYETILKIKKNSDHKENEKMLDGVEKNFNPKYFDPQNIVI